MAQGTRRTVANAESDVRKRTVGQSYDTTSQLQSLLDDVYATLPGFTQISSLGDDSADTETPASSKGLLVVTYNSGGSSDNASTIHALVAFDADAGAVTEISSGANVTVGTSALTGTSGADTDFTIGVQSDGTIDFENRRGAAISFDYATIGI